MKNKIVPTLHAKNDIEISIHKLERMDENKGKGKIQGKSRWDLYFFKQEEKCSVIFHKIFLCLIRFKQQ